MTIATGTAVISRADAVRAITDALADRTSFIVLVPHAAMPGMVEPLRRIRRSTTLVDNGLDAVLRTDDPRVLAIAGLFSPAIAVTLIPKTVSARRIGRALGQSVPEDGSRDIIGVGFTGAHQQWPTLFLAALDQVDPVTAESIRAAACT